MNIFVGNLNYQASESELESLFSEFGTVNSVKIIKDNETGRAKGFAFIEMENDSEAEEAIQALHESDFKSRALVVNQARPREKSSGGGGGFNRGGGQQRNNRGYNNR